MTAVKSVFGNVFRNALLPVTGVGAQAPGFLPDQLAGLSLWLDADDAATLNAPGDNVFTWGDKSGNGVDFIQTTPAAQPETGFSTINGRNAIHFDGEDDVMVAESDATLEMIFIVARLEPGFPNYSGVFNEAGLDDENIGMDVGTLDFRGNGNTDADDFTVGNPVGTRIDGLVATTIALNTPFIISAVSVAPRTFTPQISKDIDDRFWKGDIAEVIGYDTELSLDNRMLVENYLSEKWGIALPFFTGLQLWLDADDPSTITQADGAVSRWEDKSGNGNDVTQETSLDQPATGVNTINGSNTITFPGGPLNKHLERINTTLITGNELSVFMVRRRISNFSSFLSSFSLWETGQSNDFDNIPSLAFDDAVGNDVTLNRNSTVVNKTPHPANGTPFILSSIFISGDNNSFLNGNVAGFTNPTATPGDFNIQNARIGARQAFGASSDPWHGDIAEIILYSRALSSIERSQIEEYLSSKWGIPLA